MLGFQSAYLLTGRKSAEYRTGALNELTYQANLNIWDYIKLNGFTFQDVSDLNLKYTLTILSVIQTADQASQHHHPGIQLLPPLLHRPRG